MAIKPFLLAAALLALAMPSAGAAAGSDIDPQRVHKEQTQLQLQVSKGQGAFKDIDTSLQKRILANQDRVLELVDGKQSLDELSAEEREELSTTLGDIERLVTKAKDERQVCRKMRPTGSNRPQVVCMTAAQHREAQKRAREAIEKRPRMGAGFGGDL